MTGVLLAIVLLVAWLAYQARPMTDSEALALARKRRFRAIMHSYGFERDELSADRQHKRDMHAAGRLYEASIPVHQFPAYAASLLKGKKHEWLIIGFVKGHCVVAVWMNKGPDRQSVSPSISVDEIAIMARQLNAHSMLKVHNHPNPDPSRYTMLAPSEQDARSAQYYANKCLANGISLVACVAERGQFTEYACWVPDSVMPVSNFVRPIQRDGGLKFQNIGLRLEMSGRDPVLQWLYTPNSTQNIV